MLWPLVYHSCQGKPPRKPCRGPAYAVGARSAGTTHCPAVNGFLDDIGTGMSSAPPGLPPPGATAPGTSDKGQYVNHGGPTLVSIRRATRSREGHRAAHLGRVGRAALAGALRRRYSIAVTL